MKRIAALAVLAAAALSPAVASAQQPITLRFSSFEPPVAFITKQILTPWAERVTKDSNGALKVEMFPGGTLGRNPAQQLKLVLDGVADIAWIVPGYTPGRFDSLTVVELPFLVDNATQASLAITRMHQKGLFKDTGFQEVKVLCVCANNPIFVNSSFPVNKLDDLKGKNMRAAGPVSLSVVKALGGVPVGGITGPQLAEALSRGMVDATLNEWNALQTFRVLDVARYQTILPLGSTSLLVIMNKQKFESLPPAAKAAIEKNSGEAFAKLFGDMFNSNNSAVFAAAKKKGDHVIKVLSPEEQKPWRDALSQVDAEWQKKHPDGEKIYEAFVDELKAAK
jgi:TRAP-type C4-dicarboxylate transport system substrate-binding protein